MCDGPDDFAAAKRGELRHFDAEQAFLRAYINEDVYIEILDKYQEFPGAVGLLNNAIYRLVQASTSSAKTSSLTLRIKRRWRGSPPSLE